MDDAQYQERYISTLRSRAGDVSHDLKTPLNILILNMELLKMRLSEVDDEKAMEHCRSMDRAARRIGTIVDAFLSLLSLPPDDQGPVDSALILERLSEKGITALEGKSAGQLRMPEKAASLLAGLMAQGTSDIFERNSDRAELVTSDDSVCIIFIGTPREDAETEKALKFYYTDPSGRASVELATARILAEMYGGALELEESESDLRLILKVPRAEIDE